MKLLRQLCNIAFLLSCCVCLQGAGKKGAHVARKAFALTSPAFASNAYIPAKNACDGENVSPALQWVNPPAGTQSFALIVDDPDAPEKTWVHWVVYNIPATTMELPEGVTDGDFMCGPADFYYMKNGVWQYGGPCPPSGVHHYHFKLYALDTMLELAQDADKDALVKAMKGHVLGQAMLVGLYQRKGKK